MLYLKDILNPEKTVELVDLKRHINWGTSPTRCDEKSSHMTNMFITSYETAGSRRGARGLTSTPNSQLIKLSYPNLLVKLTS